MSLYSPKTSGLILLNTLFLALNIYLLTLNPHSSSELSQEEKERQLLTRRLNAKQEIFENELDEVIIYGRYGDGRSSDGDGIPPDLTVDPTYRIPEIERTPLINCPKLFANDADEIALARKIMKDRPKVPIYEEVFLHWTKNCDVYKKERGFVTSPVTSEEANYPLAYSFAVYTDVEQFERLLRAVYRPQNYYCIHIDIKASVLIHRTMHNIANCFPNVFVASHLDKIKWGDVSVLLPEINCMRDFVSRYRGKWNYFIDLTGQEFPLRTNYELVQIAKIFNGSNDIAGSIPRMEMDRVKYTWGHRWSKTYQQTIFYNTYEPKEPPPYNLTFYKGELHGLFSRRFVEYIIESEVAQNYLQWCWDSGHPSEHYWNVLNYNRHLNAPGGYIGPQDEADYYGPHPIIRAKSWMGHYNNRECKGKYVRGICVYGVGDLPWLYGRPELFANKFHLTFEYLGYDCLEEWHRNRTMLKDKIDFDPSLYTDLPTVKYGRKDGLL